MTHDNIFESHAQAIVNPINCVGNMGGGLARLFRLRYPEMNEAYQLACAGGLIVPGRMWVWHHTGKNLTDPSRAIINFPTKLDWRNPSEMEYIEDGLEDLRLVIADLKLESIAFPPLGCGLGGLDWEEVEPMLIDLAGRTSACLHIYRPEGKYYQI